MGRQQDGGSERDREGEVLLHETAGTWQIFGIAANKKVAKSVRKVL